MNKYVLPIAVGVGLGVYAFRERLGLVKPYSAAGDVKSGTIQATPPQISAGNPLAQLAATASVFQPVAAVSGASLTRGQRAALPPSPPPPGIKQGGAPIGAPSGPSAKDYGQGIGAAAAAGACAAAGAAIAAPLCSAAGAYLGGQAVEYGAKAGDAIGEKAKDFGNWVSGLF